MLWRRMSFALALVFGLATSQAPEFAQQYFQRLGGAIDELSAEVAAFDADSRAAGLSRDQGVAHLRGSEDQMARGRGERMAQASARLEHLRAQAEAMRGGAPLQQIRGMLADPDSRVVGGAYQDFRPALPLTADGAICAALGFGGLLTALRLFARTSRPRARLEAAA